MYHKIENHRHIATARVKHCKTMSLNKQRIVQLVFCSNKSGIETFHMTHLNFDTGIFCKLNKTIRFLYRRNYRFFNKDMTSF